MKTMFSCMKKNVVALVLLLLLGVVMTSSSSSSSRSGDGGAVGVVHGRIMGGDDDDDEGDENVDPTTTVTVTTTTTTTTTRNDENENEYDDVVKSFYIKENTSVLDYLDPSIVQDPTIIADIQDNFRQGNLIVIKDAFIPEFAEYVYSDISNNNNTWIPFVSIKGNGHNFFKHKMKRKTKIMKQVREIFKHEKSREFFTMLSGRNCMNEKEFSAL